MLWLTELPSGGRWLLTLGISAALLLAMSAHRRRSPLSDSGTTHDPLAALGLLLAYAMLTVLWMWTLEPVAIETVRVSMSLALSLGLGSLLYRPPVAGKLRQGSVVNSAGILLGLLAGVVLASY